jgi:hypothetical protein
MVSISSGSPKPFSITFMPPAAKARAMASPMPEVEPVMTADLPANRAVDELDMRVSRLCWMTWAEMLISYRRMIDRPGLPFALRSVQHLRWPRGDYDRTIMASDIRYSGELPPADLNLARYCLQAGAGRHPDKTALILCHDPQRPEDAARWSYGEIEDLVLRMAHGLAARGFAPGERMFIRMGNSVDYALMLFAANAAGLVPIPASPMLSVHEARTIIDDCRPGALVTDATLALPDLPDGTAVLGPDDIARLKRAPAATMPRPARRPGLPHLYLGHLGGPEGRAAWPAGGVGARPMYRGWYGSSPTTPSSTPAPSTGPIRSAPGCSTRGPTGQPRCSIAGRATSPCGRAWRGPTAPPSWPRCRASTGSC